MSDRDAPASSSATIWASVTLGIAKLVSWFLSGSTSLLAEAFRSFAAAGAALRGSQPRIAQPQRALSPGAPLLAGLLFGVAGATALVAGTFRLHHPQPIELWWLPLVVLALALVQQLAPSALPRPRLDRVSGLVSLGLALAGVLLTAITGNGLYDGFATLLIGLTLLTVALLRGAGSQVPPRAEAASEEDTARIEAELLRSGDFERVVQLRAVVTGPEELMVGARVALAPGVTIREFAVQAYRAEQQIRQALPAATVITIEPDVYVDPNEKLPSTEAIVFLSED